MELLKRIEQAIDTCLLPVKYVFLNSKSYIEAVIAVYKLSGTMPSGVIKYHPERYSHHIQLIPCDALEEDFAIGL